MSTLGWVFILVAFWLIYAVLKGLVINKNGDFILLDTLSKTVLGVITNDSALLQSVYGGEPGGITVKPETPLGASDENDDTGFGEGTTKVENGPVTKAAQKAVDEIGPKFGVKKFGTYTGHRPSRERAVDCHVDSTSQGNAVSAFARGNHARLGITQVIWNHQIWTLERASEGVRPYKPDTNKGDYNHEHHVHLSF